MTDPAIRSQFWQAVYAAAIASGDDHIGARVKALQGLDDLASFTKLDHVEAVANARRTDAPCAHKDAGGPCLLNDMVPRNRWCPACQAAFDILVGKPET